MTETRTRCKATTKSGTRCKLTAQPGSDYCHVHADFDVAEKPEVEPDETQRQSGEPSKQADDAAQATSSAEASALEPETDAQEPVYKPPDVVDGTGDSRADVSEPMLAADAPGPEEVADSELAAGELTGEEAAQVDELSPHSRASAAPDASVSAPDEQAIEAGADQDVSEQQVVERDRLEPAAEQSIEPDVEPFEPEDDEGEPLHEATHAATTTETAPEPRFSSQYNEQVALLVAEVEELAQELCRLLDQSGLRPATPAQAMELFNKNIGKYAPETQRALFADIQRNLQDATYRDLADPDVLRGLWYMLYFALQNQSQEVRQRVTNQLSSVPGYENMTELARRLQSAASAESARAQPLRSMALALNQVVQKALRGMRNLLPGSSDD